MRSVNPPLGEIINRLNSIPSIQMEEYHRKDFGNKVKYEACFEVWERIEASEYQAEFNKVTVGILIFTLTVSNSPSLIFKV